MAITMTKQAAEKIRAVFAGKGVPPDTCLRVGIKGGGCAGFSYTMDITDSPAEDDEVFESRGVKIVVDPKSCLYLNGTEVDFNADLLKGGFVFNNPNAKQSCGCGASFST